MNQKIRPALIGALPLAFALLAGPALAQPTAAQQSAIRAACPADFRANCSGVSPGGQAALACLQQNMAKLSQACQQAVGALSPPAAAAPAAPPPAAAAPAPAATPAAPPATDQTTAPAATTPTTAPAAPPAAATAPAAPPAAATAPAKPAAKPAAAPAATGQPTQAQQSAIRSACPSDFRANCAGVQPGGQAALTCLQQNAARLSPACKSAVGAISGGGAPAAAAPATAAPAAPPPAAAAPAFRFLPLTPRQEFLVLRAECGPDFRRLCSDVALGGGRAMACLRANAANLSPGCQQVLLAR